MTPILERRYRGFVIVTILDDETGRPYEYDVHGPESGDDLADAPTIDSVPTLAAARAVVDAEIAYRRLGGRI